MSYNCDLTILSCVVLYLVGVVHECQYGISPLGCRNKTVFSRMSVAARGNFVWKCWAIMRLTNLMSIYINGVMEKIA